VVSIRTKRGTAGDSEGKKWKHTIITAVHSALLLHTHTGRFYITTPVKSKRMEAEQQRVWKQGIKKERQKEHSSLRVQRAYPMAGND